jgi:hypothetical protein
MNTHIATCMNTRINIPVKIPMQQMGTPTKIMIKETTVPTTTTIPVMILNPTTIPTDLP